MRHRCYVENDFVKGTLGGPRAPAASFGGEGAPGRPRLLGAELSFAPAAQMRQDY